jgi:hypothetical protein
MQLVAHLSPSFSGSIQQQSLNAAMAAAAAAYLGSLKLFLSSFAVDGLLHSEESGEEKEEAHVVKSIVFFPNFTTDRCKYNLNLLFIAPFLKIGFPILISLAELEAKMQGKFELPS